MTVGITYGTFDLFHIGHLRIIERAKALCDTLVVGVSTDEFNAAKGKRTAVPFEDRAAIVGALRCVDQIIAEAGWDQKQDDIRRHGVDVLVMGNDWEGTLTTWATSATSSTFPERLGYQRLNCAARWWSSPRTGRSRSLRDAR